MSDKNLSLEDLIYLVDNENADDTSKPFGNDPFEDTPETETEIEETQFQDEDTDDKPQDDEHEDVDQDDPDENDDAAKLDSDSTETDTDEETEDSKESTGSDIYGNYFNLLNENGLVFTDEEFEFDGTAEGLAQAIEQTKKNLNGAVAAALYDNLPEEFKPVLTYALNGGQNINEFLSLVANTGDVDSIDIDTPAGQKAALAKYYAETTPFDEAKIQKLIQKSELAESLEEDAQEAFEALKEIKTKKAAELIEEQKQRKDEAEQAAKQQRQQIQSLIDEAEYIKTNRKNKVKAFIFNEQTNSQGQKDTQFRNAIVQIASNPEHLIQLADLLLDYDPKSGISLDRFKSAAQTSATKSLKEKLEEAASAKSKVSGKGGRHKVDNFDWEEFLKQN